MYDYGKLMLYSSFLNEQYTQATYIMYQQYILIFTTFCNTGQMGLNRNINIEQRYLFLRLILSSCCCPSWLLIEGLCTAITYRYVPCNPKGL